LGVIGLTESISNVSDVEVYMLFQQGRRVADAFEVVEVAVENGIGGYEVNVVQVAIEDGGSKIGIVKRVQVVVKDRNSRS
jgi:hypothetical protein